MNINQSIQCCGCVVWSLGHSAPNSEIYILLISTLHSERVWIKCNRGNCPFPLTDTAETKVSQKSDRFVNKMWAGRKLVSFCHLKKRTWRRYCVSLQLMVRCVQETLWPHRLFCSLLLFSHSSLFSSRAPVQALDPPSLRLCDRVFDPKSQEMGQNLGIALCCH